MKKNILFTTTLFIYSCFINAQVLYNDNFENYTLGDVAADVYGQTPGQGGWHTMFGTLYTTATPANFQIENETNKGKVLTITTGPVGSHGTIRVIKKGFDVLWNQRTPTYNVLKFEIEMFVPNYTGNPLNPYAVSGGILMYATSPRVLAAFGYNHSSGLVTGRSTNGLQSAVGFNLGTNNGGLNLSKNQWYQLIYYIDYDNSNLYVEIPTLGIVRKVTVFDKLTPPDTMKNYPPTELHLSIGRNDKVTQEPPSFLKFDNIKMTALKSVPPHILSTENVLAQKFYLYPNPANNVVNITNTENMLVNQVTVYDSTGKQLNTHAFNNETQIQFNVENLASGTYMLHIQTENGTAVKKLVKK